MNSKKNIIMGIIYFLLGTIIFALSTIDIIDEFWSGMGSGFIVIGIIRIIKFYRLRNNTTYRENVETEINDERNRYIRTKAWSWTGYSFTIIAAILSIVFKSINQDLLSIVSGFAVILQAIIYWLCYLILKKKY